MVDVRADGTTPTSEERARASLLLRRLKRVYGDVPTALAYEDPWQLLVATTISAQTTDENVNKVTPVLFAAYPSPEALSEADPEDVEKIIYSTGFYRQKTKSIISLSEDLVGDHNGQVPINLAALVKLRGVGRKTASVVLAEAFGRPAIAVDTHVKRVAHRLDLTKETDPAKVEQDLKAMIAKPQWSTLSMRVIQFGRDTCHARNPACERCPLAELCSFPR